MADVINLKNLNKKPMAPSPKPPTQPQSVPAASRPQQPPLQPQSPNPSPPIAVQQRPPQRPPPPPIQPRPSQPAVPKPQEQNTPREEAFLQWSAYEHTHENRSQMWFLWPGIIALALVLFGIFTQSFFFAALIVFAFMTLMFYAGREPQKHGFAITEQGIFIDRQLLSFPKLKSFYIFSRPDFRELSLETDKILFPFLHIPLGPADPTEVREVLAHFLPEKEHPILITDVIFKKLGL